MFSSLLVSAAPDQLWDPVITNGSESVLEWSTIQYLWWNWSPKPWWEITLTPKSNKYSYSEPCVLICSIIPFISMSFWKLSAIVLPNWLFVNTNNAKLISSSAVLRALEIFRVVLSDGEKYNSNWIKLSKL